MNIELIYSHFELYPDRIRLVYSFCGLTKEYNIFRENISEMCREYHIRWVFLYIAVFIGYYGGLLLGILCGVYALVHVLNRKLIIRTKSGSLYMNSFTCSCTALDPLYSWYIADGELPQPPPIVTVN